MASSVYIRPLLALLVTAAISCLVVTVLRDGSHGTVPDRPVTQQLPHNIDIALKKARFSEIQDGLVVWELAAERADYDKTGDVAYLSNICMEFQHSSSHGTVTVTADSGVYYSSSKNIRLKGNVHVVTEDGADFKTGSIVYSGATAKFSTIDPVIFRQQRMQLTAIGMDLTVKSQRALFYSAVEAVIINN